MSFDGKVALVTGGTSGIGCETAKQFAQAGAKVVLAGRRTEQGEAVVNTSSILGQIAMPGAAVYNASKHAMEGITKTTALELAEQGIRVNSVAPGAIATHMIDRFAGAEGTESRQQLASQHPMGRLGEAKEIAAAVLYLASDAASFTTGISLPVDGGYLAK